MFKICIDKALKEKGKEVYRSAKNIVLALKMLTIGEAGEESIKSYFSSISNVTEVNKERFGLSLNTLKNLYGYINSDRYDVNKASLILLISKMCKLENVGTSNIGKI